jgi:predicted RNA-binding protein with PUA-like domain
MAYWLVKTEPETFSWDEQVKKGKAGEPWTGVRNHTAKLNLMKMKKGDRAFFYHSGAERRIVGTVEVIREHYPDPTDETGKFVAVDVKAIAAAPRPVTLADVRAQAGLADMALLRLSRLSVQPVTAREWSAVCKLAGLDPR